MPLTKATALGIVRRGKFSSKKRKGNKNERMDGGKEGGGEREREREREEGS